MGIVRHLAGGEPELTCELTEAQYRTLDSLALIEECPNCTGLLSGAARNTTFKTDDEHHVYHPSMSVLDEAEQEAVVEEIRSVLSSKKH